MTTERAPGKRKVRPSSDYLPELGPVDETTDNEYQPDDSSSAGHSASTSDSESDESSQISVFSHTRGDKCAGMNRLPSPESPDPHVVVRDSPSQYEGGTKQSVSTRNIDEPGDGTNPYVLLTDSVSFPSASNLASPSFL